ncbi:alpha/beta-hydrolase [Ceratobasidium sp. AG-I]|nr:alpha/beta-hydrolase [Ceratobasidium sp. AG-I]
MKHKEILPPLSPKQRRIPPYARLLFICALVFSACQFFPIVQIGSRQKNVAHVGNVTYVGHRDHKQTKYLGIPYAHPPTGALRFRPPVPYTELAPTNGTSRSVRAAYAFGPSCPQSTPVPYLISEDCLTVNVWVPHVPRALQSSLGEDIAKGLPVLVWIYGGAFINGSTQKYPADELVQASVELGKPVVVASMNYRLGMFGFPLGAESVASNARNLGLLDQRLALEWVHTHIAQFGGDPTKITIFGESAGSVSVGAQMSFKGGKTGSIFRGAIMQSGTPSTMSTSILSKKTRQAAYDLLAQYLSCPTPSGSGPSSHLRASFECVRRSSTKDIQEANWEAFKIPDELKATDPAPIAFGPTVDADDEFFFDEPAKIARNHQFVNVPLLIGGTLDEGTDFVPSLLNNASLLSFFSQIRPGLTFGIESPSARQTLQEFIDKYPDDPAQGSPYGTGDETFGKGRQTKRGSAVFGDWLFEGPRREFTREAVRAGLPVWSYQYAQPGFWAPEFGVGHFADVQMIFRWFDKKTPREMVELSNTILSYWLNFAYYLNPSPQGAGVPEWLQYGSDARSLQLKAGNFTLIKDDFRKETIEWLMREKSLYV